jgi:hypothetical protein
MPDHAETPNVFLDTQVFDNHQYDLSSPYIKRLVRLVNAGLVNLFLTTVTLGEVEASILKALKGPPFEGLFTPVSEDEIHHAMREQFHSLLTVCRAIVLRLDGVSAENVFKSYFAQRPPFGSGGKKNEFPDAFAAAALHLWCEQNEGQKMYVVTEDEDWKGVCRSPLIYRPRLVELLADFADSVVSTSIKDALVEQENELRERIREEFDNMDFFFTDLTTADVEGVEGAEIEIGPMHVVETKDGFAIVSIDCTIDFTVLIIAEDEESAIYDSETKIITHPHSQTGTYHARFSKLVDINIMYDVKNPEQVTLESVEFDDPSIAIDPDKVDFHTDEDGE